MDTKILLILRHAKSSWKKTGLADHDRPLNKRGKRDAPRMGRLIRDEELLPDLILSSTAKRARSTAKAVAEQSGFEGEIRFERELYAAGPEKILAALEKVEDRYTRVMVVAHNPGLEELLEILTGETEDLPTAALAQISLSVDHWQDVVAELGEPNKGKLLQIWRPRELS